MSGSLDTPALTSELDYWVVDLKAGGKITLRAHGAIERDGYYVFVALMRGDPAYEYELVRIPKDAVEDFAGGWPTPREDLTG